MFLVGWLSKTLKVYGNHIAGALSTWPLQLFTAYIFLNIVHFLFAFSKYFELLTLRKCCYSHLRTCSFSFYYSLKTNSKRHHRTCNLTHKKENINTSVKCIICRREMLPRKLYTACNLTRQLNTLFLSLEIKRTSSPNLSVVRLNKQRINWRWSENVLLICSWQVFVCQYCPP